MIKKGKLFFVSQFAIGSLFVLADKCAGLPVDLGAAGPQHWTVLETGSGTITQSVSGGSRKHRASAAAILTSQQGILGNVGVGQNGRISDSGAQFSGDLFLGNNSSAKFSGSFADDHPVTGMAHLGSGASVSSNYSVATVSDGPQPMLDQARIDATQASAAASALAATSTLNQINLKRNSLTLDAGVYNLSSLHLSRSTLTLSGSGSFVFNISSVFSLKSAQILLAGGATEANVLFNYTGTKDVKFSGRGTTSVLHGIVLALNARVNLAPGLVVGEIISGRDIALSSGSMITNVARRVAVPDAASTFALSLIALGCLAACQIFAFQPCKKQAKTWRC
jgi:hypothetical protein